jgi:glycosyltransferase involved in cell wall biosynthesis
MESPGKVLIIVQNLPVPFDRRVWLEANTLKDSGYEVSVISPKGKEGKFQSGHEVINGIHIYRYRVPPEAKSTVDYFYEFVYCWIATALLSLKIWFSRGFNVIQACNPPETFFLLARFYKLFGVKFIFDHHDLSPEMYVAKGGRADGFLYRCLLWLENQTFRTADVVISTNESYKEIARLRGRVLEEKIFVVRNGPDFDRLKVLDADPGLKNASPYLACYLGEMCRQDGVEYLLKAIKVFVEEIGRRDVRFVLMGGGPALEELRSLNTELKLDSHVIFTGRVSDEDLCRYLSTADICLDPDPYSEWADQSTMNKIMEYMAFGKPIVAFNLRENRYSAQDAAVYARPNDVTEFAKLVSSLLDDEEKRRNMGSIGLRRVREKLAWTYSKPSLLSAYETLRVKQ